MSWQKQGAMLDEGCRAEARAKSMQQEREEVCAAAASFPCLVENGETVKNSSQSQKKKWNFVDQTREETKHRTERCAEANKCRCMRCGKRKQVHEDARKMHRTKILVKNARKWRKSLGGRDLARRG